MVAYKAAGDWINACHASSFHISLPRIPRPSELHVDCKIAISRNHCYVAALNHYIMETISRLGVEFE